MVKFFQTDEKLYMAQLQGFREKCWVDMINPTDDEVEDIVALTGIPEEMIKAALDEEETARVEIDEGNSMFLVDTPIMRDTEEGDSYETLPIAIIFNEKCIVTVSLHGNAILGDFISNRIKADTSKPVFFLLNFMMGNAKKFLSYLRQIDKKSLRVQAELHRSMKNKELIQLLELENSLVYFSTSLSSNMRVYGRVKKLKPVTDIEEYQDLYEDVIIENTQAIEMCNIYRNILKDTMDAFASVISNNMNVVMKLLTIVTLIISVPTLIASLWGMNVPVPFEGTEWGFWVIVAATAVVTAVVGIVIFRTTASNKIESNKTIKRVRGRKNIKKD
ncbi:MAG: magnesium transporter CorA family protein [Clostridia bacterium]|nr:magnesium transporter CorA family protein [Clostridia bacterium]